MFGLYCSVLILETEAVCKLHFDKGLVFAPQYALKVERSLEAKTVRAEAKVLKALQASQHVVRLVEQGTVSERSFMVMEVRTDTC